MYAHTAVTVSDCIALLLRRRDKRKGRKSSSSSALYQHILTQGPQHMSASLSVCLLPFPSLLCLLLQMYNLELSYFLCHLVAPHPFYFPVLFISCFCSFACQSLSSPQTFCLSICLSACPCVECVCHFVFSVCHVCVTSPKKTQHSPYQDQIILATSSAFYLSTCASYFSTQEIWCQ